MTRHANTRWPISANRLYSDSASSWMKLSLTSCLCWRICTVASKSSTYLRTHLMSLPTMLSSYKRYLRFELDSSKTRTGKRLQENKVQPSSHRTQSKSELIWTASWNYTRATYSRTLWMTLSARNVAPWQRRGAPAARWPGTAPETASSANGRSTSSSVRCFSRARRASNNRVAISLQRRLLELQVPRLAARRRGHSSKSCDQTTYGGYTHPPPINL